MVIVVASGKGGTGKTTVATALAAVAAERRPVQFLDLDVEEPNAHLVLKPRLQRVAEVTRPLVKVDQELCTRCGICAEFCAFNALIVTREGVLVFPELCHGCGVCSYYCPVHAMTEEPRHVGDIEGGELPGLAFLQGKLDLGAVATPAVIAAVKERIQPQRLVVADAPPGTSCAAVEALRHADYCLLVTESTRFALADLRLVVELARRLGIPVGLVINRCPPGERLISGYAEEEGLPVLGRIPFDRRIALECGNGANLVEAYPPAREWLEALLPAVERQVRR